jgi:DNA-binding MarR family transcriptional regulator
MQAAGFIERIRNPADERQMFVELTECGKSLERRSDVRRAVGAG